MKQVPFAMLALSCVLAVGGCNQPGQDATPQIEGALFGDGTHDPSEVIANVDGYQITQRMLDMRMNELDDKTRLLYQGEEGKRAYSRQMVFEYLRVKEAERRHLDQEPDVARALISAHRHILDVALSNDLIKNKEPSIEQIRQYYLDHKDQYKREGSMHAAHIECATKAIADKVYAEAASDKHPFANLVHDYSIDEATKDKAGDLGWFNRGGFLPGVKNGAAFTVAIWDCKVGVNPPIEFGGHWHVVKVYDRQYERPQTLDEAYQRVLADMKPEFQHGIVDDWQDAAKEQAKVEYFGDYRPGKGLTAQELFERAGTAANPNQKMQYWTMLIDDYPQDPLTDDAMFLAANYALDTWGDKPQSARLLRKLIKNFPDSEYASDAQYIIDNMGRPDFVQPKSIEDLKERAR